VHHSNTVELTRMAIYSFRRKSWPILYPIHTFVGTNWYCRTAFRFWLHPFTSSMYYPVTHCCHEMVNRHPQQFLTPTPGLQHQYALGSVSPDPWIAKLATSDHWHAGLLVCHSGLALSDHKSRPWLNGRDGLNIYTSLIKREWRQFDKMVKT